MLRRTRVSEIIPEKPVIPKGYSQFLELVKLSTDISSQKLEWWLRQRDALKNVSVFGYQNDAIKMSYLCNFVDRDILSRRFKEEKGLLAAILGYIYDSLHPILIAVGSVEVNNRAGYEELQLPQEPEAGFL